MVGGELGVIGNIHGKVEVYMSNTMTAGDTNTDLPLEDQIQVLEQQHCDLDAALREEEARPLPNSLEISDLKRKKLAVKDQLAELTGTE